MSISSKKLCGDTNQYILTCEICTKTMFFYADDMDELVAKTKERGWRIDGESVYCPEHKVETNLTAPVKVDFKHFKC